MLPLSPNDLLFALTTILTLAALATLIVLLARRQRPVAQPVSRPLRVAREVSEPAVAAHELASARSRASAQATGVVQHA